MGFFSSMADKTAKGLDWGKRQVTDTWSATVNKVGKSKDWTVEKTEQAVAWTDRKKEEVKEAARDKVHNKVREQTKVTVKNRDLLNSIDRRKDFTSSKAVQFCKPTSGPPVEFDGYFLGKDCKKPTNVKPKTGEGHKPTGCENCAKEFPQVTFTNGINNSLEEVCKTIEQLSNDLCMEVVGVFNASYKEAIPPPRSAEENMALLKAGYQGAGSGAVDGLKDGIPEALVAGLATGGVGAFFSLAKDTGKGLLKGLAIETGKEGLKQQASRWAPESQDALDVIDTLAGRSQQPATIRMADDIANQLRDGKQVNLIAHSEGGVNTAAAIAQAKSKLADEKVHEIFSKNPNIDVKQEMMKANLEVEANMAKNLNVTLLGTQQTGLPDGPNYMRMAHKSDLIPDTISGAQDALGRPGHNKEPASNGKPSPAVERFSGHAEEDRIGSQFGMKDLNPATAHSMKDSYIPYMREKTGRTKGAPCC